ncbi:MAG TPA: FtsH protease activity modulator HflK [Magnetospirillum sp.]|jgi:membrane protease subunit HflK|nr:FtsH protease activity modulator HflK [Magnetospirillum sp.]
MTAQSPNDSPASTSLLAQGRAKLSATLKAAGLGGRGRSLLAGFVLAAWALSGIYRVQPDEQAVVLRFDRWVDTQEPGLHYHWPAPIERVILPKVTQINQVQVSGRSDRAGRVQNQMVTGDENVVEADYVVFWKIKDAGQFLFRIADPEATLRITAESAVHNVISHYPIQAALSDRRQQIADEAKDVLQRMLDSYQAGILVTQVQLQRVDPPAAVIDAFNDVQRARADQERARNEAEAYANDIIPRARGEAERMAQEAAAYKTQVVNLAKGEIQSVQAVYESYKLSKDVTSWRLYLDSVDSVLRKAGKVIIDSSGKGVSSVVPYMPLSDKTDKAQGAKP